jgi:acetate kinase
MRTLAFNAGGSSLKFRLIDFVAEAQTIMRGAVMEFGPHPLYDWTNADERRREACRTADHPAAAREVIAMLMRADLADSLAGTGHRVVYSGEHFAGAAYVTDELLSALESLSALAPLHNPSDFAAMRACREHLTGTPMVAVFDTAFFHDPPEPARVYGLRADAATARPT